MPIVSRPAVAAWLVLTGLAACSSASQVTGPSAGSTSGTSQSSSQTYDVDALGVPQIAGADYIDLAAVGRVSLFRSAEGHDYHDDFESCRSMKHYVEPRAGVDWSTVRIFAPVQGAIELTRADFVGLQLVIRSTANPAFTFIIFHVNPSISVAPGTAVALGQQIGTHIGSQTQSDIAVGVQTPKGYKLVSWFDVMSESVFSGYAARGVASRASAVISRTARDADPLSCSGETFTSKGAIAGWLTLR